VFVPTDNHSESSVYSHFDFAPRLLVPESRFFVSQHLSNDNIVSMNSSCEFATSDVHHSGPLVASTASFSAMGFLCCIQMFFMIGLTFRRWSGLYFWTLTGASVAQLMVCFSLILQVWILKDRLTGIPLAMSTLGYLFFAPCEFLVLYSRLHLLRASKRALIFVLIITFLEWLLAELPMAINGVLAAIYPDSEKIALANKIWWEFEEVVYPLVDFALCFLYFLQVKRMWGNSGNKMKWVLRHIAVMSAVIILIDISYLVLSNTMDWVWVASIEVWVCCESYLGQYAN
jgi:hypothetical protein